MPKKQVVLPNGKSWPSQVEAEAHFRDIRDRHDQRAPIDKGTDFEDLCALLEVYDRGISPEESKTGPGIRYFETRTNKTNGGATVGFWVIRVDGTAIDFSFPKAVAWASRQPG